MSSLTLYRELIPAHHAVDDDAVGRWLTLAARRHTVAAWGAVYAEAMVFWTAAHLEPQVRSGALGITGAACAPATKAADVEVRAEPYWGWYLEYQKTRSVGGPGRVPPWL